MTRGKVPLLVVVTLPFAAGYALSYFYRTVNAVLAPELSHALNIGPAELGLLTSTYFFAFILSQIPLGLLLDRHGPRKVESTLLLVAAVGAAIFAVAESLPHLLLGRLLIGLGVSACLMAAFKAIVIWFPADRIPLMNGLIMAAGGAGALTATRPVEMLLDGMGWRGVFAMLAIATVAVAFAVFRVVPDAPPGDRRPESWRDQIAGVFQIFTSPLFLRLAPVAVVSQAIFQLWQGLWAGPWLMDVVALSRAEAANVMLLVAAANIVSHIGAGALASALARRGHDPLWVFLAGNALLYGCQVALLAGWGQPRWLPWVVFGAVGATSILCYAILTRAFPVHLAGRVNTALNLLVFVAAFAGQWGVGILIGQWAPDADGHHPAEAYQAAMAGLLVLHTLALGWLAAPRRAGHAPPRRAGHAPPRRAGHAPLVKRKR